MGEWLPWPPHRELMLWLDGHFQLLKDTALQVMESQSPQENFFSFIKEIYHRIE